MADVFAKVMRFIRVATLLGTVMPSCQPLHAQQTGIGGVVRDGAGRAVGGALVKVSNPELGFGFMMVTDVQGQYRTPNLPPGAYSVQGFAGTNEALRQGLVEVIKSQSERVDLILNAALVIPERPKRMTDSDYEKLMPEQTGKHEVVSHCTACHTLGLVASARKTPAKWRQTVDRMADDLLDHLQILSTEMKEEDALESLLVTYLSKYFGPDEPIDPKIAEQRLPYRGGPLHPNRNLPTTLLKGVAAKYVALEFSVPAGADPQGIAVDSYGIAWISERNTGNVGRLDPNSLTYARIPVPVAKDRSLLGSIAIDSKNRIWLVDDGPNARILQYDPKTLQFTSFPLPEYPYLVPDSGAGHIATLGFSNGSVWATRTNAQRILKLDPSLRRISEYAVPKGSSPFGLTIDANNMIWYTAEIGNEVVKLDPNTGKLTSRQVPTPRSDLLTLAADTAGNLWTTASGIGKLLKIDGGTGTVTEFEPPTPDSGPFALDVDAKRNLVWFSEISTDRMSRFDPASQSFVEFPLPSADLDIRRIMVDQNRPDRLWWCGASADKMGYIEVVE